MIEPIREQDRFERVMIIAGGESLKGVDLSSIVDFNGAIITINNSIFHLPRADFWITVDPCASGSPQRAMTERREGCYYYTAQPNLEKEPYHAKYYPIVEGIHYLERVVPPHLEQYLLQEEKDKITTGDSSFGALGLAYHFEPKQILILGLDVYGDGHWYDTDSKYNAFDQPHIKFSRYKQRLVQIFAQSTAQLNTRGIEVLNGSLYSRVNAFRRITPQEALRIALN